MLGTRLAGSLSRLAPARPPPCPCLANATPFPSLRSLSRPRTRPSQRFTSSSAAQEGARRPIAGGNVYQRAREEHYKRRNRSLLLYSAATVLIVTAGSYLAVPLYRVFCSTTGYGGTPDTDSSKFTPDRLIPRTDLDRRIRVTFNADASDALPWSFEPQQKEVRVLPGETALAFYTATNHSSEDIIGIATYNVTPQNIAPYFAKVECFCFEEQRLLAGEEVDLPVFFFIDRDFVDDPLMKDVREVTLSYTFFRARRDSYGNLVPSEGPLAVPNSVPAV
ncbi:cytochromec oxidase assembly protein COX11 [Rhodotorula toruloides]|uniref:Cytochromec oxidase assembly protein COX11 n=1 Tax=Rhodotorula toruloides TaxID=5286 RepID=A0A511KEK8_RHOTO|nr:cytochromec oxidase assembly protein COX11 [Rhodotorula toruloides]